MRYLRQLRLIAYVFNALRALLLFTWTVISLIQPSPLTILQPETWRTIDTVQVPVKVPRWNFEVWVGELQLIAIEAHQDAA